MNKAVFLDRDGTINKEVHYLRDPEQLELLARVPEAIKMLNEIGFKVIIVTNQSAIARGFLTIKKLNEIHVRLKEMLGEKGAAIDAIYFCPHHPGQDCECRKPKPYLILKAAKEHSIDLKNSYMIGDKYIDIKAGKNSKCKTIFVLTGYGEEERESIGLWDAKPDYTAIDLYEAVMWIRSVNTVIKKKQINGW